MEDRHEATTGHKHPDSQVGLFGVFDGHGGSECANFVSNELPPLVLHYPELAVNPREALTRGISEVEDRWLKKVEKNEVEEIEGGTTLVLALFVDTTLYIAHVGDSEAVLCRSNKAVPLTSPHNPSKNPKEGVRVKDSGGRIFSGRLGHPVLSPSLVSIGVSRAIGDAVFKLPHYTRNRPSGLVATPDIISLDLQEDDKFVILACDGLWDVVKHQEAVEFLLKELDHPSSPAERKTGGAARYPSVSSAVISPKGSLASQKRKIGMDNSEGTNENDLTMLQSITTEVSLPPSLDLSPNSPTTRTTKDVTGNTGGPASAFTTEGGKVMGKATVNSRDLAIKLAHLAYEKGSNDNITVVVISLY